MRYKSCSPVGLIDETRSLIDSCYAVKDVVPPEEPQGPSGTVEKYNLLDNFENGRLGAFDTVNWEPGYVNNEVQYYRDEQAVQGGSSLTYH